MSVRILRRLLLYFCSLFFFVFGGAGLFAPAMLAAKVNLLPLNGAGMCELRTLYGGGFLAFGAVILAGLRCRRAGAGLLLAMSLISGGLVLGRLVSLGFDHDAGFASPAAISEFIMAVLCFFESRRMGSAA